MNLREQVGQLIIVGVEGVELSPLERAWLKLIRPGGVILFRRNIEQASQVTALLRDATEIAGAPLFRCVDMEGGLVDRLRDLIAPMPSAAAVFATGKPANFVKHGRLIAREARALGFNVTFAPVLDLALPISAAVMRTRAVSADHRGRDRLCRRIRGWPGCRRSARLRQAFSRAGRRNIGFAPRDAADRTHLEGTLDTGSGGLPRLGLQSCR